MELARVSNVLMQSFGDVTQNKSLLRTVARSCCYFALSPIAVLTLLAAVLAYMPAGVLNKNWPDLSARMAGALPSAIINSAQNVFANLVVPNRRVFLSVGILLTLWFVSSAFSAAIEGLDVAYDVGDDRSFWKTRSLAVALAVTTGVPLLIAFGLMRVRDELGEWLAGRGQPANLAVRFWPYIDWTAVVALAILAFYALYLIGPNVRQGRRAALPGVVVAVVCWIGLSYLLGLYLHHFSTLNNIYGMLSAAVALVVWLYWTGFVALVGAGLNAGLARIGGQGKLREKVKPCGFTRLDIAA